MPENFPENNDSLSPQQRAEQARQREIAETADAPAGSHQKDLGAASTGVLGANPGLVTTRV